MVPAQEVPEQDETLELGRFGCSFLARALKTSKSPSVHESGRFELHSEMGSSKSVMTVEADESTDQEVA